MFQPPPGPKAGRYAVVDRESGAVDPVSIPRPARKPGATRLLVRVALESTEFQSPPGPKAGRYYALLIYKLKLDMFQSPPGPKAGRYSACARSLLALSKVSIPARPESRALPEGDGMNDINTGFQSPPGPKAGRYQQAQDRSVSIMLTFQSPPGPKAGRYSGCAT